MIIKQWKAGEAEEAEEVGEAGQRLKPHVAGEAALKDTLKGSAVAH